MDQMCGYSKTGDAVQVMKSLGNPKAVIFFSEKKKLEKIAADIHQAFPGVVSIGCAGQSYAGESVYEDGLLVIGFDGVEAVGGVIPRVGTMPLASIESFRKNVQSIKAGTDNTVCIDFTTGNDAELVTTMNIVLRPEGISLVGATAGDDLVACNGRVYQDASAYMLLRNLNGRVKTYKENLYDEHPDSPRYVATKVDPARCGLLELDGKPAQKVYGELLGLSRIVPSEQTIKNPLGRVIGDEIYLMSLSEAIENGGFACYKKVNAMDIITVMELKDMETIIEDTLRQIRADFPRVRGMFSVNCVFRHILFQQKNYESQYLRLMNSLGCHAGMIGHGEHFNTQHVNQTMTGFAFD